MESEIETFEEELNSIIRVCDERIECYKALLEEYRQIKGTTLSLLNLNSDTKRKGGLPNKCIKEDKVLALLFNGFN
jgi:hypothetical protein